MTLEEIKSIDFIAYLAKSGLHPKRNSGKHAFYLTPLGEERVPSFVVNKVNNTFRCYHSDKAGSIIDYIMAKEGMTFKEAVRFLEGDNVSDIEPYVPQKPRPGVIIHSVEDISSKELLDYFCGVRKISEKVLRHFCSQVEYSFPFGKNPDNTHEAIGFKSDLGGYELRSSWAKVAQGTKSHTTIKGSGNAYLLTEGFTDALSYFTYYDILTPPHTMFVLNGAGQFPALNKFIGDKKVYYYGDNDAVGDRIASEISNLDDMRHLYPYHKDMNSYLVDI